MKLRDRLVLFRRALKLRTALLLYDLGILARVLLLLIPWSVLILSFCGILYGLGRACYHLIVSANLIYSTIGILLSGLLGMAAAVLIMAQIKRKGQSQ